MGWSKRWFRSNDGMERQAMDGMERAMDWMERAMDWMGRWDGVPSNGWDGTSERWNRVSNETEQVVMDGKRWMGWIDGWLVT